MEFNFSISGVDTEAPKNRKTTDFIDEFQLVVIISVKPNTKMVSPMFIILNDDEVVHQDCRFMVDRR